MKTVDAIVLAAGSSARFGSDKRLYPADSLPMLQRVLATVIDSVRSVIVVLRADDEAILPALLGHFLHDSRIRPVLLDRPESGMGGNLARAVSLLPADCAGVLVMLADLPFVRPCTVCEVVSAFDGQGIVVPVIAAGGEPRQGHPVLFPQQLFSELRQLSGDEGARRLLHRYRDSVVWLPVQDEGILRDVDVPVV